MGLGPGRRPALGLICGQAHQGGIKAAKTQPLGQAAQGLIHQELHGSWHLAISVCLVMIPKTEN
jgi:hypothetical protein